MAKAMTPKQRAALRKAQLASARKRKGRGKTKAKASSTRRRKKGSTARKWAKRGAIGYGLVNGAAAAAITPKGHRAKNFAIGAASGAVQGGLVGAGAGAIRDRMRKKRR